MDNMTLYEQGRAVPKEACKSFHNGSFSGTDINPMWRIKKLTEMFGPAGFFWTTKTVEHWTEMIGNEIFVYVRIELRVRLGNEWSQPIEGVGGNKSLQYFEKSGYKASDEAYKMAYTDALSVACKALGIGADVYFSADATKYSQYYDQAQQQPMQQAPYQQNFNNQNRR